MFNARRDEKPPIILWSSCWEFTWPDCTHHVELQINIRKHIMCLRVSHVPHKLKQSPVWQTRLEETGHLSRYRGNVTLVGESVWWESCGQMEEYLSGLDFRFFLSFFSSPPPPSMTCREISASTITTALIYLYSTLLPLNPDCGPLGHIYIGRWSHFFQTRHFFPFWPNGSKRTLKAKSLLNLLPPIVNYAPFFTNLSYTAKNN